MIVDLSSTTPNFRFSERTLRTGTSWKYSRSNITQTSSLCCFACFQTPSMKMCSAKEVQINISRRDSCQSQLFLTSVKILKKELYHRFSSEILIMPSRTHHVSFLFKLIFLINILFTEFFVTTIHYKVLSNLSKQVKYASDLNLKDMYDRCPVDVPRTSHQLVPGTSRHWFPQTFRARRHLELLNICFFQ